MNYQNGLTMNFPVSELLEKLKVNRINHDAIVKESQEGYLKALEFELGKKLARLKEGKKINPTSRLSVPGDNLDEYDTAIEMLTFTSDNETSLSQAQFHSYVMDKWSWQKNFLDTASEYSVSGSAYLTDNKW